MTLNANARVRVNPEWIRTAKSPTCCGTACATIASRRGNAERRIGQERGGDDDAVAEVVHGVADQDHEPRASLVAGDVRVHCVIVLVSSSSERCSSCADARGATARAFSSRKNARQASQDGDHHAIRASFFQRMRQQFEEHRAEQRADRERDQPRNPSECSASVPGGGQRRQARLRRRRPGGWK